MHTNVQSCFLTRFELIELSKEIHVQHLTQHIEVFLRPTGVIPLERWSLYVCLPPCIGVALGCVDTKRNCDQDSQLVTNEGSQSPQQVMYCFYTIRWVTIRKSKYTRQVTSERYVSA